ncbi:MAG: rod shape-determining protein MreD [Bergeyella sp.]|nr:rod shape-determining protein MreD [Bergeyella sp.]
MISRNFLSDIFMILLLASFQVFVLNRLLIFGRYTPVMYPLFVMFYRFYANKYAFLTLSFILGLLIDIYQGTWGINSFATTAVAYFRTLIFCTSTDTQDFFSFHDLQPSQFWAYIFFTIFLHQLIVMYLEFFKLSRFFEILFNVSVSSSISFIFILLYAIAFRIKQNT